jgi:hypothetical protein
MPKLLPRITAPVYAIKLKKDLLAERGHWLLVMEDESLMIMTDLEVKSAFRFEAPAASATPAAAAKPPRPYNLQTTKKRLSVEISGKTLNIGSQMVRVLDGLQRYNDAAGRPTGSIGLKPYLFEPDFQQATARLSEAKVLGLVTISGNITPYQWSITNNGREVVRLLSETAAQYATKG